MAVTSDRERERASGHGAKKVKGGVCLRNAMQHFTKESPNEAAREGERERGRGREIPRHAAFSRIRRILPPLVFCAVCSGMFVWIRFVELQGLRFGADRLIVFFI